MKNIELYITEKLKLNKDSGLDLPESNIKDIEEIDIGLPFVFSDRLLEIYDDNNETAPDRFNGEYLKETVIDLVESTDWRIPSDDDIRRMRKFDVSVVILPNKGIYLFNAETNQGVAIKEDPNTKDYSSETYWLYPEEYTYHNGKTTDLMRVDFLNKLNKEIRTYGATDYNTLHVRLIKDK